MQLSLAKLIFALAAVTAPALAAPLAAEDTDLADRAVNRCTDVGYRTYPGCKKDCGSGVCDLHNPLEGLWYCC